MTKCLIIENPFFFFKMKYHLVSKCDPTSKLSNNNLMLTSEINLLSENRIILSETSYNIRIVTLGKVPFLKYWKIFLNNIKS